MQAITTSLTLKISEQQKSFVDPNGNTVEYTTNYLKDSAGGKVIEMNSKDNFAELEGKDVVVKLNITPQYEGKGYKVTIAEMREKTVQDEDLEQIAW